MNLQYIKIFDFVTPHTYLKSKKTTKKRPEHVSLNYCSNKTKLVVVVINLKHKHDGTISLLIDTGYMTKPEGKTLKRTRQLNSYVTALNILVSKYVFVTSTGALCSRTGPRQVVRSWESVSKCPSLSP